jgi:hypothetical protein
MSQREFYELTGKFKGLYKSAVTLTHSVFVISISHDFRTYSYMNKSSDLARNIVSLLHPLNGNYLMSSSAKSVIDFVTVTDQNHRNFFQCVCHYTLYNRINFSYGISSYELADKNWYSTSDLTEQN